MAVFELRVELIDPDARRACVRIVASATQVLRKERLYDLFKGGFK